MGLLALWFIVKKLNRIVRGIQKFSDGDLKTRIEVKSNDDLEQVGTVFNSMADTIEQNTAYIASRTDKLQVLSVAGILAEALRRIHNEESLSSLFV